MKHLLFIPTYNCEKQIIRVLDSVIDSKCLEYFQEILIIDNNSEDSTLINVKDKLSKPKFKKFSLCVNNANFNLGGTHKVAFNYAIENQYDYVSILHGDDQGEIDDLFQVLNNNKYHQYDCILASRFNKKSILINYPKYKIYLNYMINLAASIITFKKLTDLGSCLNMFKVSFLKNKFYLHLPNDLTFNYSLILYICKSNARFFYFPQTLRVDDQESNVKLLSHTLRWLKIILKYIFYKKTLFKDETLKNIKYAFKKIE